jgi:hypothetical protein
MFECVRYDRIGLQYISPQFPMFVYSGNVLVHQYLLCEHTHTRARARVAEPLTTKNGYWPSVHCTVIVIQLRV